MQIDGQCHCGAMRFTARASPKLVSVCHCADCQTMAGSAFRLNVTVVASTFELTGTPSVYEKTGTSGEPVVTAFCATCGTPLYSGKRGGETLNVRLGWVNQRDALPPQRQGFCEAVLPWVFDLGNVPRV